MKPSQLNFLPFRNRLNPILHFELLKNRMDVFFSRTECDSQPIRNFLIGQPFADILQAFFSDWLKGWSAAEPDG